MVLKRDLAAAAEAARKLGHIPLCQGRTFECSKCGASGIVGPDGKQVGLVFTKECK